MEEFVKQLLSEYPIIAAVIIGLWVIRKAVPPTVRWVKRFVMVINNYDTIVKDLSIIAKELKPNGGSSIKDCISRIEESLFEKNEKHRIMMSMNETPLFETDSLGRCTYVNRWYSELTGLSYEECMGYGWLNAVKDSDKEPLQSSWSNSVSQHREYVGTHNIVTNRGEFKVKCRAFPIHKKDGSVSGYEGKLEKING